MRYLSEDGLAYFLLHRSFESLHLRGHTGGPVDVRAGRMVEAPLLLCHLQEEKVKIYRRSRNDHNIIKQVNDEGKSSAS